MWQFDGITDYIKAARLRLADAHELLQPPSALDVPGECDLPDSTVRHLRGALYLAGYAVECSLKAYILAQARSAETFSQVMDRRSGDGEAGLANWRDKSHSLPFLWRVAGLETQVQDPDIDMKRDLPMCLKWSPDWRYDPRPLTSRNEASRFYGAVGRVYRWVNEERRLLE